MNIRQFFIVCIAGSIIGITILAVLFYIINNSVYYFIISLATITLLVTCFITILLNLKFMKDRRDESITEIKDAKEDIKEYVKGVIEERFIPYLKTLDDKNYRLWKARATAEEKLELLKKKLEKKTS